MEQGDRRKRKRNGGTYDRRGSRGAEDRHDTRKQKEKEVHQCVFSPHTDYQTKSRTNERDERQRLLGKEKHSYDLTGGEANQNRSGLHPLSLPMFSTN